MSCKGFRYKHCMKSDNIMEYEEVNFAYTQAGWKEIGAEPENGIPKAIVFEWTEDGPPVYPVVNWPHS